MTEPKSERKRECLWCRKSKGYRGFEAKAHQCRECMKRVEDCITKEKDPRLIDWGVSVESQKVEELTSQIEKIQIGHQSEVEQKRRIKELELQVQNYIKMEQDYKELDEESKEKIQSRESQVENNMKTIDQFIKWKERSDKEIKELKEQCGKWKQKCEELQNSMNQYNALLTRNSTNKRV